MKIKSKKRLCSTSAKPLVYPSHYRKEMNMMNKKEMVRKLTTILVNAFVYEGYSLGMTCANKSIYEAIRKLRNSPKLMNDDQAFANFERDVAYICNNLAHSWMYNASSDIDGLVSSYA